MYNFPMLAHYLDQVFSALFLNPSTLEAPTFWPALCHALGSSLDPVSTVIPHIFELYVAAAVKYRHIIYSQPSTSRLSYELHLADKLRSGIRSTLSDLLNVIDTLPTIAASARWSAHRGLWQVVETWGGYLETDTAWGETTLREANRAKVILESKANEQDSDFAKTVEQVLKLLAILESLDHARADIQVLTLGWALAVG
jgi:hypothetical protein